MKTMVAHFSVSLPDWEVLEDESLLVQAAQMGDLESFDPIVLKYQDALYNLALPILEQEEPAADALQEALISAFQHLQDFQGGSLKAWLMRIVVNKCYDQARRSRRFATLPMNETLNEDSENENELLYKRLRYPPASVEEQVEARQLKASIQLCLRRLPMDFRTIVTLVDVEGMSYTEVAAILDIPVGTVKSRLARARYDLQRKLKACL